MSSPFLAYLIPLNLAVDGNGNKQLPGLNEWMNSFMQNSTYTQSATTEHILRQEKPTPEVIAMCRRMLSDPIFMANETLDRENKQSLEVSIKDMKEENSFETSSGESDTTTISPLFTPTEAATTVTSSDDETTVELINNPTTPAQPQNEPQDEATEEIVSSTSSSSSESGETMGSSEYEYVESRETDHIASSASDQHSVTVAPNDITTTESPILTTTSTTTTSQPETTTTNPPTTMTPCLIVEETTQPIEIEIVIETANYDSLVTLRSNSLKRAKVLMKPEYVFQEIDAVTAATAVQEKEENSTTTTMATIMTTLESTQGNETTTIRNNEDLYVFKEEDIVDLENAESHIYGTIIDASNEHVIF